MEIVVDTNAISDHFLGHPFVRDTLRQATTVVFPTIVIGEFLTGIDGGRKAFESRELFGRLLEAGFVAPIDRQTAETYARVQFQLRKKGTPIPTNDVWIAAVAIERQATLLSRDRHFDHIEGLRRIDWS